jgi:hypothetical protein
MVVLLKRSSSMYAQHIFNVIHHQLNIISQSVYRLMMIVSRNGYNIRRPRGHHLEGRHYKERQNKDQQFFKNVISMTEG